MLSIFVKDFFCLRRFICETVFCFWKIYRTWKNLLRRWFSKLREKERKESSGLNLNHEVFCLMLYFCEFAIFYCIFLLITVKSKKKKFDISYVKQYSWYYLLQASVERKHCLVHRYYNFDLNGILKIGYSRCREHISYFLEIHQHHFEMWCIEHSEAFSYIRGTFEHTTQRPISFSALFSFKIFCNRPMDAFFKAHFKLCSKPIDTQILSYSNPHATL